MLKKLKEQALPPVIKDSCLEHRLAEDALTTARLDARQEAVAQTVLNAGSSALPDKDQAVWKQIRGDLDVLAEEWATAQGPAQLGNLVDQALLRRTSLRD